MGAHYNVSATSSFICEFIVGRLAGFEKDMAICLEPIRPEVAIAIGAKQGTRAYLPAIMTCCGLLEFLGALWSGKPRDESGPITAAKFFTEGLLPAAWSDARAVGALWAILRHKIAHHTHPYYVTKFDGDRFAWMATEQILPRAFAIDSAPPGAIVETHSTPWGVPYTHKFTVSIRRLQVDVVSAAHLFMEVICDPSRTDRPVRMANVNNCLREFMPPA